MRASLRMIRVVNLAAVSAIAFYFFLLPGVSVLRDLSDEAYRGPGVPRGAWRLHRDMTPRFEAWALDRVASGRAANVEVQEVTATEWPIFASVFYLMATEQLQASWQDGGSNGESPMGYASGAVAAAKSLVMDPKHHTWVRAHWGADYLHRENVFFRSLLIAGLTSYEVLTRDGTALPVLRDQVESLSAELDQSKLGVLRDYPGECYPPDVVAAIGFIRKADAVLGTNHEAFAQHSLRAFEGPMLDSLGLIPYRMNADSGHQEQSSRGTGNSWVQVFAPDLWSKQASDWYARYEGSYWQDRGWAAGFREFGRGKAEAQWQFEIDAGPVVDGFGTAASAFGIAAARRNGRFDHAYTLSMQMLAVSWPLPSGTLLGPRALSQTADAPYLGEAAILYLMTVQPAPGVAIVKGGTVPWLVWLCVAAFFSVSALAASWTVRSIRRLAPHEVHGPRPWLQAAVWGAFACGAVALFANGAVLAGLVAALCAREFPIACESRPTNPPEPSRPVASLKSLAAHAVAFRMLLLTYCAYAGVRHLLAPQYRSSFGGTSQVLHELGHVAMGGLGGTLLQLLVPAAIAAYFALRQRDYFGSAVGGAWFSFGLWETATWIGAAGQTVAPYRGVVLTATNEWSPILAKWGLLGECHGMALLVRIAAVIAWAVALGFGGWLCVVWWRGPALVDPDKRRLSRLPQIDS